MKLKFRLFDGTDLGPRKYVTKTTITTITTIKENIILQWPQGTSFFFSFPLILFVYLLHAFLSLVSNIEYCSSEKMIVFFLFFAPVFFPPCVCVYECVLFFLTSFKKGS
jgi:hypothetical protein